VIFPQDSTTLKLKLSNSALNSLNLQLNFLIFLRPYNNYMTKWIENQSAPSPPPVTQSPSPRVERTIPINNSTPYRHPHARSADAARPPPSFQDHLRKDEEWRIGENSGRWVLPRAELSKFDGSNLRDWLEDCDYFFSLCHTPEFYKVSIVIPYLLGEAREWHIYFKLSNPDPTWPHVVEELRDRFDTDLSNHVNEFKKVHQTNIVDNYINSYE
jgi:hypothetical protein